MNYINTMSLKVFIINVIGNFYDETVISNNQSEAKRNVQLFNPSSKVLEANWIYK